MKSSIGILKEEYNGVRNQRDTALTEVQRIKKEGQRVLDQIQEVCDGGFGTHVGQARDVILLWVM